MKQKSSSNIDLSHTFLQCSASEWKYITLPEKKLEIKSIIGTAVETVILTKSNELFYYGDTIKENDYITKYEKNLFQFNLNLLKNYLNLDYIPVIKEIFGTYRIVILQLENDECILLASLKQMLHVKEKLIIFATCPLSYDFIAITENNKLKVWNFKKRLIVEKNVTDEANEIIVKLLQTGIKILSCGGNYSIIVTNDNKMYVEGPNTYNSMSGVNSIEKFEYTYLQTPFEEMSEIKQLKCGYYHTVVLLNNGKVFASGYNYLKQCGHDNINESKLFTEFKLPIGLNVKEIGCTSRGTYFKTYDKIYFVGEAVEKLPQEKFGNVTAYCLSHQSSPSLGNFNTISFGGWHYNVYKKPLNETKGLIYFSSNLRKAAGDNHFNDILLNFY